MTTIQKIIWGGIPRFQSDKGKNYNLKNIENIIPNSVLKNSNQKLKKIQRYKSSSNQANFEVKQNQNINNNNNYKRSIINNSLLYNLNQNKTKNKYSSMNNINFNKNKLSENNKSSSNNLKFNKNEIGSRFVKPNNEKNKNDKLNILKRTLNSNKQTFSIYNNDFSKYKPKTHKDISFDNNNHVRNHDTKILTIKNDSIEKYIPKNETKLNSTYVYTSKKISNGKSTDKTFSKESYPPFQDKAEKKLAKSQISPEEEIENKIKSKLDDLTQQIKNQKKNDKIEKNDNDDKDITQKIISQDKGYFFNVPKRKEINLDKKRITTDNFHNEKFTPTRIIDNSKIRTYFELKKEKDPNYSLNNLNKFISTKKDDITNSENGKNLTSKETIKQESNNSNNEDQNYFVLSSNTNNNSDKINMLSSKTEIIKNKGNTIKKIDFDIIKKNYQVKKNLTTSTEVIQMQKPIPELLTQSLIGLVNLGSTCFMNAGIQNLIHCIPFITQLYQVINEFKENINDKIITCAFLDLCSGLLNNNNYNIRFKINSYNPTSFRRIFCKMHKIYDDYGQHDSLEFLRVLLDDISKELNQTKIISKYKELVTEGKTKEQQSNEYNNFFLCRENSIIVKVFYTQIMNIFTCKCGDVSYSFEKLLDIPLLFPKNKKFNNSLHLNQLINMYFEGETLTWSLKCPKCEKKEEERDKKIKFVILPQVIIFSLQRFDSFTNVKINEMISFDEDIDLKPFCEPDLFNGEMNTKYRLFGINNHIGSINFGHYYSYTKVGDNWYKFDDSSVIEYKLRTMSSSSYFFFYEKIE